MASDVKVFTGVEWVSLKGEKGDPGASGPTVVSSDAGNLAALGTDGRIFVSQSATDTRYVAKAGDTMTGQLVMANVGGSDTNHATAPMAFLIESNSLPGFELKQKSVGSHWRMFANSSNGGFTIADRTNPAAVVNSLVWAGRGNAAGQFFAMTILKPDQSASTQVVYAGGTNAHLATSEMGSGVKVGPGESSVITSPAAISGVEAVYLWVKDGAGTVQHHFYLTAAGMTYTGPATISGNAYPTTHGAAGQVLSTDGAGVLSWADAGAAGNVFRTILAEDEAGTKGDRCWDANWEYRCIDTNTWRRWRRFTWDESDPSSGVSVGSGTGAVWRMGAAQATPGYILYSGGKFVGVQGPNGAYWSTDGLTWSLGTGGPAASASGYSVAYNGGTYATANHALNTSSTALAYTSADGKAWTQRGGITGLSHYNPFIGASHGYFHAFSVALGAAVGSNVVGARSANGITWAALTITGLAADSLNRITGLASNGSVAVAVGYKSAQAGSVGLRSTDGATWTKITMPSMAYKSICHNGERFVAVGTGNVVAHSTDGTTWQTAMLPATADWAAITYGAGRFVAVAAGTTTAARSTDGITWEAVTIPEVGEWTGLAYGAGRFVAVADGSTNQKSAISE